MHDSDATTVRSAQRADDADDTVMLPIDPDQEAAPQAPEPAAAALPQGFRLQEYRIDGVLGQGNFGITYLATDVNLDARVVIKEYLPLEIAFRSSDQSVSPAASRYRHRFQRGLETFLVEARTLAGFRHPAIVRVARFFEAHRTAYLVLEHEKGSALRAWWPQRQALGERGLLQLLLPLLDGLAVLHASGVLHRDIKPDNIHVRSADDGLVLLDFGAAGLALALDGPAAVAVTPGYAAPEQYDQGEQGPWTDLYALGATLYWLVSGRKPADAQARITDPRAYRRAVEVGRGRYGEAFLGAIDWALSLEVSERPRDVLELRHALITDHAVLLGPQEALQAGDTVIEGDRPAPRPRARGALRNVVAPAAWPLTFKLTLALLAAALLPALLASSYAMHSARAAVEAAQARVVEQAAQGAAGRLAQFVADRGRMAHTLAADHDLVLLLISPDELARQALRDKLARAVQANPDIRLVTLQDGRGNTAAASEPELAAVNLAGERFFQQALQGQPGVSGPSAGAVAPELVFVEPVKGDDGVALGALVLHVRTAPVDAILDEVRHDAALQPLLVDGEGMLIHPPQPEWLHQRLPALAPTLATVMVGAKAAGHESYSAPGGHTRMAGFAPVAGLDWVVGVSEERATFESTLSRTQAYLWAGVLFASLLFAALGWRLARALVAPVRHLTQAANAVKAGDFNNATVPVQRKDEIGLLARTFNVMIDVLRQRERERHK